MIIKIFSHVISDVITGNLGIKKYFIALILVSLLFINCNPFYRISGMILIKEFSNDYRIGIYDLNTNIMHNVPFTNNDLSIINSKRNGLSFTCDLQYNPEFNVIISLEGIYNEEIATKRTKTIIHIYSMINKSEIYTFELLNYRITDYQFISPEKIYVLVTNYKTPYKILLWNPVMNKIKELYVTDDYLTDFRYYENLNIILFKKEKELYRYDITNENIQLILQPINNVNFCENVNRAIFENNDSLKYLDLVNGKIYNINYKPCSRQGSYTFIDNHRICIAQEYNKLTLSNFLGGGRCHFKYKIFDIITGFSKTIYTGESDVEKRNISYFSEFNLELIKE
ncbi:MAG: hypothetical protein JXB17_13640 [Bacteroidales bacterium]|nr:hypothetical protein [Bacteroidales bacterium]